MNRLIFTGEVTASGDIKLPKAIRPQLVRFFSGNQIKVVFSSSVARRSKPQNRYYWGVVIDLITEKLCSDGIETTPQKTHEILKYKFLKKQEIDENTGEVLAEYLQSTTELEKKEFIEYITKIQAWSAEFLDMIIPDPTEAYE